MSPKLARPIGQPIAACVALTVPALVLRLGGVHPPAAFGLLAFGAAVVAASFLLAWAAEAARLDIAGPLAIAILAVIAVLPEYAVDLYFSYTAGHNPDYVQYAAANMTGSNRLLLGLGWPVVVLTALWVASRRSGRGVRATGAGSERPGVGLAGCWGRWVVALSGGGGRSAATVEVVGRHRPAQALP